MTASDSDSGKPATEIRPLYQIDDGRLLNQLPVWAPEAATPKLVLVDNPARLYQFWNAYSLTLRVSE